MAATTTHERILIQGIGNPSRGDDALGPLAIEKLEHWANEATKMMKNVDLQTEWVYQLQIEQAEQWSHYDKVVLIDAHASLKPDEDFVWQSLQTPPTGLQWALSSHQLSPEQVLCLNRSYFSSPSSVAVFVLGLNGEKFELGEGLSPSAQSSLLQGLHFLQEQIQQWAKN